MVWVPVLRARPIETAAKDEADTISDPRALEFVDADGALSRAFAPVINLPPNLPAWDVYFVYGPEARWPEEPGAKPPAPTYWMHQLGRAAPSELRLDASQLNSYVNGMLLKLGK